MSFNDESYRNAVLGRSERLRAEREGGSEFDQVFEDLESPDYPATCDQCGMEGTNADMDEHACDEPPAPRAGERDIWQISRYRLSGRADGQRIAVITAPHPEGGGQDIIECLESVAEQVITDHNQYTSLTDRLAAQTESLAKVVGERNGLRGQRRQLIDAIRDVVIRSLLYYEQKYDHDDQARLNLEALLATIEQEGEA